MKNKEDYVSQPWVPSLESNQSITEPTSDKGGYVEPPELTEEQYLAMIDGLDKDCYSAEYYSWLSSWINYKLHINNFAKQFLSQPWDSRAAESQQPHEVIPVEFSGDGSLRGYIVSVCSSTLEKPELAGDQPDDIQA